MSNQDNPFANPPSASGYGNTNVAFGDNAALDPGPKPATPADGLTIGGANAVPEAELIKETTTADFQQDVIAESRNQPVLIDFWAPWCGPCKQLTPIIETAVRNAGGKVKLVKMNIDDHPAIPGQMGVQSIPAVIAFVNGQPVDGFMGAKPESEVAAFIDKLVKTGGGRAEEEEKAALAQAIDAAKASIESGDPGRAAQIFQMILERDPENADAYGGLAGLLADNGQPDQARQMIEQAPEGIKMHPAVTGVTAKLELAEKLASIGDEAELVARLNANPDDHDARFEYAQILNAKGERDAVADELLSIMKADREWRDDGARKELLVFFEAWGPMDPATLAARRKLSSLLFR